MMGKYRVHEVAKDLGIPSKEVVELLAKYFPDSPKTHMAALEREELSVVLEHYSQTAKIDDIGAYLEKGKQEREANEKLEAAKAEELKKADSLKSTPEKTAAKAPSLNKKETALPKVEAESEASKIKPEIKPSQPIKAQSPAPRHDKKVPAKQHEMKTTQLPNQGVGVDSKPTVSQTVEQENTKKVDMRTVNVNLDKYNERYETIAPANVTKKKDTGPSKQRINDKRRKKGKPILSRREKEEQKQKRAEMERQRRQNLEITVPEEISVTELAARLKVQAVEVVKLLMGLGIMASAGEIIDYDTAAMIAIEIGAKVFPEVVITIEDRLFEDEDESEENMVTRPPVVVVMGHVDHGKTSTLDAIRETRVTHGEAGGITQHIGAYQVDFKGRKITFLDTPGHAAFTSMRSRGAQVTDIAIIVVAADDGIMPQTVEAINHAKAAGVTIIVAINKMDKPEANPDKIMQALTEHELVPEEWGGDTVCVKISAQTGEGLDELLEMIQLNADMLDLKADPTRAAKGTVIEARLDKGRGSVATILVQTGTLRQNDVIIAGTAIGRVRAMTNDQGEVIEVAGPSTPVEIIGLSEAPGAGDTFNAVADERLARELADQRRHEAKEEQFSTYKKVTLENLFDQISEGEMKELPIIVKADVQGSVEAVTQSLEKLTNEEVRVRVIHGGVGAVSESDVMLANASNAIIVGFNVRPDPVAKETADRDEVDVRLYRVIYDAIDEIETAMKGMLDPKYRDIDLGRAEVRDVFKITNVGAIAGCYVVEGKILRNAKIRVVRDGVIVADDVMSSLRRFKDDVKEVAQSFECGIGLEKFNDMKVGDFLEAYITEEYRD